MIKDKYIRFMKESAENIPNKDISKKTIDNISTKLFLILIIFQYGCIKVRNYLFSYIYSSFFLTQKYLDGITYLFKNMMSIWVWVKITMMQNSFPYYSTSSV